MANTQSGLMARRYATALLDMAMDARALEGVEKDLREFSAMLVSSPDLQALVRNPLIGRSQQRQAVTAVAEKAQFNKLTISFLGLLAQNRRLSAVSAVIDAFRRESAARRGEVEAHVQTAYALTPAQTDALQKELSRALGSHVSLNVEVARDLLGGMIVTVGSRMIDDSLKRKLERLKRTLSASRAA
ncbi:MAG: F0F1 ATP synthase subunit delta [Micavibrio aeruginosavorus]|uniref:ATP synthase subunit delta n=1 Tax=Micavibrio aeruginosavorus TaxID=349221 RepID=A0A7T5R420_9BACT|nr:MAG: F0F1 ATP synthase subunit delta [Micavibrio aeruginosavorus]